MSMVIKPEVWPDGTMSVGPIGLTVKETGDGEYLVSIETPTQHINRLRVELDGGEIWEGNPTE